MPYYRALLTCHIAVFFMGTAGVFAEAAGFHPWRTTAYRVTLGGLVLGLLLLLYRKKAWPSARITLLFLGLGVVLGLHWFAFFKSLALLGVILGSAMIGIEPIIICLTAAVLLRERFTKTMTISAGISLVGFAILGWGTFNNEALWKGIAWSVFAFLLFGFLVVANRKWVATESPLVLTFLQMLGAIPLTWIMSPEPLWPENQQAFVYALVLGVLCTGLAHGLYNASMKVLSAPLAGLLLSLEVVYGLLGGWVIGDRITNREMIAAIFITNILVFDIVSYIRSRKTARHQSPQMSE